MRASLSLLAASLIATVAAVPVFEDRATCPRRGYIYVKDITTNVGLGLLRSVPENYGTYNSTTKTNNRGLIVCLYNPASDKNFYIRSLNAGPPSGFSTLWLGLVSTPYNNGTTIGNGNGNYAWISQVQQTAHGAKPTAAKNSVGDATLKSESSVWRFKSSGSNQLVPHWKNSNGKTVSLDIINDSNAGLWAVAQKSAFLEKYPNAAGSHSLAFYFAEI